MSTELSELVVKKNYSIPMNVSNLCEAVLGVLSTDAPWINVSKLPRSAHFRINCREKFARFTLANEGKALDKVNLTAKYQEYDKNPILGITKTLKMHIDNVPVEISYIVTEQKGDECSVETTCKPVLYAKIVRGISHDPINVQDIRISNEEFLDQVFIGGLGGKEIHRAEKPCPWQLLVNDSQTREIAERVYHMLEEATTCVLIMGCWFGTDCIPLIKSLVDSHVQVMAISHNPSERKGPVPVEIQKGFAELVKLIGPSNVSTNPSFHGRVLIVDNMALVGSMDLNAFSLSGEHIEFAVHTNDSKTVRTLTDYFRRVFVPLK